MPDWQDWLEGLGGAAAGVTQGLTAGAAPFAAWDKVVASGLANDSAASKLRNEQFLQAGREGQGVPDFYGNAIGAQDIGNQLISAKGKSDIYGLDRNLELQRYLADPNGAFQQGVEQGGMQPGDAEYRSWLAQAIAMYDPQGSVKANDSYGIPAIQQRNVNEEAILSYVTAFAQKADKGAQAFRTPDGRIMVMSSDGTEVLPAPDALVRSAAMFAAKTPYDAMSQGIKDEALIAKTNAEAYKVVTSGGVSPAQRQQYLSSLRVSTSQELTQLANEYKTILASEAYKMTVDPAEKEALVADVKARGQDAYKRKQGIDRMLLEGATGRMPTGAPPAPLAGPRPQGGPSVNAKRLSATDVANLAAGGAAAFSNPAVPAGMPGYPTRRASARDTGIRPITDPFGNTQGPGPMNPQDLEAYVQSLLQGG